MNPFQRKRYQRPAQAGGGSPAVISSLFEAATVPVGEWMSLPRADRDAKAVELIRSRQTEMGDSSIVRRMMDAYALAYETARTALS